MKNALLLLTCCVFAHCSKSGEEKDRLPPTVVITSPANNEIFNGGATVGITANLTDDRKIAEVHVHISNNNTGALLVDIHRNPGTASYTLNETFPTQAGIEYKIQVIAKDNSANENRATVNISTN